MSAGKECSDHRHSDMEKDSSHGYIMNLTPIEQAFLPVPIRFYLYKRKKRQKVKLEKKHFCVHSYQSGKIESLKVMVRLTTHHNQAMIKLILCVSLFSTNPNSYPLRNTSTGLALAALTERPRTVRRAMTTTNSPTKAYNHPDWEMR